jgi:Pyridoxamine 5'-phosphate oxidase
MDPAIDQLLSEPRRVSVLATSDPEGLPNLAVIACARPQPDGDWVIGLGDNRTLANLRATGRAALLLCLPGESLPLWQGARIYLEAVDFATAGPLFETVVAAVTAEAGHRAGRTIRCAVRCKVTDRRPLVELPSPIPSSPA